MIANKTKTNMKINDIYSVDEIHVMAKDRFAEERAIDKLEGWFLAQEIIRDTRKEFTTESEEIQAAFSLKAMVSKLPLTISKYSIFAGTQDDAFARTYALINPEFKVETFTGYNDVCGVFGDIDPSEEIPQERIDDMLESYRETTYVKELQKTNDDALQYTEEAVFFIEQVTGHIIPDFKLLLHKGANYLIEQVEKKIEVETNAKYLENYKAMKVALEAYTILAERYADIAEEAAKNSSGQSADRYNLMARTLRTATYDGAKDLYEAIQLFLLAWQCMCIEQQTNPYAFSVGNADRIFEPFRAMKDTNREEAATLFEHFLVFFNIADRSWAISQNIIVGGKSSDGEDLTNSTSYSILDAYFNTNMPQPILSVKLHQDTPDEFYQSLGRFLFTPGMLTPSFFSDDTVFKVLEDRGVDYEDLEDYSIAGCQEPLIMGKDNGNTTNTWLNLAKILEITLNDGYSTLSGKKIGSGYDELGYESKDPLEILKGVRDAFYNNLEELVPKMSDLGDRATKALSHLRVPFLSTAMGGLDSGIDMRDYEEQGTKYNGSGCLIHGTIVVADSFVAIDELIRERPEDAGRLIEALRNDFEGEEELRQFMATAPKFGNAISQVDNEAAEITERVANLVNSQMNYLGNPFRADFSTPSTHLLYGYWTGATPDGRKAREMLNYGLDPLYGESTNGVGFRVVSSKKLPYELMTGGHAIHFGLDPKYFTAKSLEGKGLEFRDRIIKPLFFGKEDEHLSPFYLYVNVATPEMLRKVLEEPKEYAPSGVYIVRIHGTFVNFLDLSPAIQQDIIKRLDLGSTTGS